MPTVRVLPGANKHELADGWPAVLPHVLLGDITQESGWRGQGAKAGTFEALRDAPVARLRAENHDGHGGRFAESKLKPNAARLDW